MASIIREVWPAEVWTPTTVYDKARVTVDALKVARLKSRRGELLLTLEEVEMQTHEKGVVLTSNGTEWQVRQMKGCGCGSTGTRIRGESEAGPFG